MKLLTRDDIEMLARKQPGWCVSLYMPTHRASADIVRDQSHLKDLLRAAELRLLCTGLPAADARAILAPAHDPASAGLIWREPAEGLLLFCSLPLFRFYQLPTACEDVLVVARHFHLKGLLPLLNNTEHFYVLALGQQGVRLLDCTHGELHALTLEGARPTVRETLPLVEPARAVQWHRVGPPGRGGRFAIYEGQGTVVGACKDPIVQCLEQVDEAVREALRDTRAPLVLAASAYLTALYREVNTYPHLFEEALIGSPDGKGADELYLQAQPLLAPHWQRVQQDVIEAYRRHDGGPRATHDLTAIVRAARAGRVQWLLVARDAQQWGQYDPDHDVMLMHAEQGPDDEDLLDDCATQAFLHGGSVYVVPNDAMPAREPMVAMLRA